MSPKKPKDKASPPLSKKEESINASTRSSQSVPPTQPPPPYSQEPSQSRRKSRDYDAIKSATDKKEKQNNSSVSQDKKQAQQQLPPPPLRITPSEISGNGMSRRNSYSNNAHRNTIDEHDSRTQRSGQKSKVHKVTHYGRLRTTIARALRLANLANDRHQPTPPHPSRIDSFSNQDNTGSLVTPHSGRTRASLDASRLMSPGATPENHQDPAKKVGAQGAARPLSSTSKRHSVSTSITTATGADNKALDAGAAATTTTTGTNEASSGDVPAFAEEYVDQYTSLSETAMAEDENMLIQHQDDSQQEMGRAIPLPGFFLEPDSDEWMGGYSYRARSRDPFTLFSVPASLTKRVHYEVSYDHPKNGISTARYNIITFLPAQLTAQFSKIANVYFLFISILQQVPGWSTTGKWSTLLPLCVFVSFSIAHEGYDDFRRHRMDRAENRQKTRVLKVKVHDTEHSSFHLRQIRDRSSHSLHEFRRSTSSGIKQVFGGLNTKVKGIHRDISERLAEKRRRQREAEDSQDEEDEGEIEDERELGDVEDAMSMNGSVAASINGGDAQLATMEDGKNHSMVSVSNQYFGIDDSEYAASAVPLPHETVTMMGEEEEYSSVSGQQNQLLPSKTASTSQLQTPNNANMPLSKPVSGVHHHIRTNSALAADIFGSSASLTSTSNVVAGANLPPNPPFPPHQRLSHHHVRSPSMSFRSNTPDMFSYGTPMTRSYTDRIMMAGEEGGGSTTGIQNTVSKVPAPRALSIASSAKESQNQLATAAQPQNGGGGGGVMFAEEDEVFDIYDNPLPSNMSCRWKRKRWENVQVGDLLVLLKDEWIPADCVVLASSGFDGICYVETAALDGETTLKQRQALKVTNESIQTPEQLATFNGITYVEKPNPDLYSFEGYLETDGEKHPLTPTQLLLRGSVLRNTQYVFVQVVYSGEETRLRLNATRNIRTKSPQLQRITNRVVVIVFCLLVLICIVFSWIALTEQTELLVENWYLGHYKVKPPAMIFGNVVMMNALIPISLYVTLEAIKIFQMYFIQVDVGMYHEPTKRGAEARTTTINEDLGMVRYIFSDKTGTLTENIMKFRGMLAGGISLVHRDVDREESAEVAGYGDNGEEGVDGAFNYSSEGLMINNLEAREEGVVGSPTHAHHYLAEDGLRRRNNMSCETPDSDIELAPFGKSSMTSPGNSDTNAAKGLMGDRFSSPPGLKANVMVDSSEPISGPKESLLKSLPTTRALLKSEFNTYQQVYSPMSQSFKSPSPLTQKLLALSNPSVSLSYHARRFLRSLALCHTVQPDFDDKTGEVISYQSASPDEKALVVAAAEMGYVVSSRAGSKVQLRIVRPERLSKFIEDGCPIQKEEEGSETNSEPTDKNNKGSNASLANLESEKSKKVERIKSIIPSDDSDRYEDYEVLDVIEFTSARKRMSVVYKCPNGKIYLFTKGADSVIWPRLRPSDQVPLENDGDPFVPLNYRQPMRAFTPVGSSTNLLNRRRQHLACPPAALLHSRSSSTNSIDFGVRSSHPHLIPGPSANNTRPQTPSLLGPQAAIPPHVIGRGRHSRSHSHTFVPTQHNPSAHNLHHMSGRGSPVSSPGAAPSSPTGGAAWSPYLMNPEEGNAAQSTPSTPPPVLHPASNVASYPNTRNSEHSFSIEPRLTSRSNTLPVEEICTVEDENDSDVNHHLSELSSSQTPGISRNNAVGSNATTNNIGGTNGEEWNREKAHKALHLFATEGLRTLVYAHREIPLSEYEEWHDRYIAASTALVDRQKQVEQVANELERDLCFTGVSAIEDRLQDGVPETIYKLRQAEIKIWMLTGDKVETAINIAKSCRLIDDTQESDSNIIMLTGVTDPTSLRGDLERAFSGIGVPLPDLEEPGRAVKTACKILPEFMIRLTGLHKDVQERGERGDGGLEGWGNWFSRRASGRSTKAQKDNPASASGKHDRRSGKSKDMGKASSVDDKDLDSSTATCTPAPRIDRRTMSIVVDGETLATLEANPKLLKLFLELGTHSNAVVCSRVSPAQKALVVHHMRIRCQNQHIGKEKYAVTVAIGDGGNDIAMIQESHVGIGIAGQEGLQAARSADFSISQFRFLQRLILVHGRWSYIRISSFTMGTFYKCMAFYLTQAYFGVFTAFSGTSIYESWTLSMYNTLFSLLPVMVIGVFDQDLQADTLLKHPELYPMMGPSNHMYTPGLFIRHVILLGIIHCILVGSMVLIPYYNLGEHATSGDLYTTGFLMFSSMILVVTFKIAYVDSRRWTWLTHAGAALSLVLWFGWNGFMGVFYPDATSTGYFAADVFQFLKDRGAYWALIIVVSAIAVCVTLLFRMGRILNSHTESVIQQWVAVERNQQRAVRKKNKSNVPLKSRLRTNYLQRVKTLWKNARSRSDDDNDSILPIRERSSSSAPFAPKPKEKSTSTKDKLNFLRRGRMRSDTATSDPNIDFRKVAEAKRSSSIAKKKSKEAAAAAAASTVNNNNNKNNNTYPPSYEL
ncbi:hypothetical protein H4219_004849 [Mycoemilia scoparia]|uniref:P-type phospholipid transporter n=1 Tax=Mycoemilia scoparia TaxID=417184 RepID=A0A9W7ZW45_9FUNG|nr:hypothetical protein H4219_004849 [Mycoemilia scoparia]